MVNETGRNQDLSGTNRWIIDRIKIYLRHR